MRSTWFLATLAAGLVLVAGVRLSTCGAAPRKSARKAAPAVKAPVEQGPSEIVDGYGPTARDARARAIENAQDRVAELLRKEAGDPTWQPPAEQLDPEYLERFGVIAEADKPVKTTIRGAEAVVARYKVQLTDEYFHAVQKVARQERVFTRDMGLFRLLGGVLAVLLVVTGYLRLEEMTRGYATQLLRLGAVAVLGLAAFGIWLTL
jgi:hypothetical protein